MQRHLFLFLLIFIAALPSAAQTIIEFGRGGAEVRSKNLDDYKIQRRTPEELRQDSAEYRDCLTRAFNCLHADSLAQARKYMERALKLLPEAQGNQVLHRELGKIAMIEGKYGESIGHFDVVMRQSPMDLDTRLQRASCHIMLEHPQQALDDCRTLLQHTVDSAVAVKVLFLQSAAHRQLRQYPQVGEDLRNILRLDPRNSTAQLLQAMNLVELGQVQEGLNRLNLYVSAHPKDVEGLKARAEALLSQHQLILARADADEAISLKPGDAALYLLRAKILDEMGEKRLAKEDRRRAKLR